MKRILLIMGILLVATLVSASSQNVTQDLIAYVVNESVVFESHLPLCPIESKNIFLNVSVLWGECEEEVWAEVRINDILQNHTAYLLGNSTYRVELNSTLLNGGETIEFQFFAKDCLNFTYNNSIKTFTVKHATTLSINPEDPDGDNGWYINPPVFTLTNPDAVNVSYQWNSGPDIFTNPSPFIFGLENVPWGTENQGIKLFLKYWSDVCEEEHQQQEIFVDLLDPMFKNFVPSNNSKVNSVPEISVLIDNIIGEQSSGINENSIVMKLNNVEVSPAITPEPGLNLRATYSPGVLAEGIHTVFISAIDNAGRYGEAEWTFELREGGIGINIISPDKFLFDDRRIPFNISLTEEAKKLEYIDNSDSRPRPRTLCRNCDEYGEERARTKSFRDGEHNLTIIATNEFEETSEVNVSFFIDSRDPRIYRTEPRRNSVTNGSDFYVKFKEDNPEELMPIINGINLPLVNITSECTTERSYTECYFELDLSTYNTEEIEYWFNLTDIVGNIETSRPTKVIVDIDSPKINNYPFYANDSRYIYFNISITEENLDRVSLQYDYRGRTKDRRLCSRLRDGICEKKFRINENYANFSLIIKDDAGNFIQEEIILI